MISAVPQPSAVARMIRVLLPAVAIRHHRRQSFAVGATHLDIAIPSRIAHDRTDPVLMGIMPDLGSRSRQLGRSCNNP